MLFYQFSKQHNITQIFCFQFRSLTIYVLLGFWINRPCNISGFDPWTESVDKPETVEADAASPMHYILCIDDGKFHCFF